MKEKDLTRLWGQGQAFQAKGTMFAKDLRGVEPEEAGDDEEETEATAQDMDPVSNGDASILRTMGNSEQF